MLTRSLHVGLLFAGLLVTVAPHVKADDDHEYRHHRHRQVSPYHHGHHSPGHRSPYYRPSHGHFGGDDYQIAYQRYQDAYQNYQNAYRWLGSYPGSEADYQRAYDLYQHTYQEYQRAYRRQFGYGGPAGYPVVP